MRLILSLCGDGPFALPLNYNYAVQSMLYSALPDEDFRSALHEIGYPAGNKTFRLFTFGPLMGAHRVDGKTIRFQRRLRLEVRSPFSELLQRFSQALLPGQRLSLLGQELAVEEMRLLSSPKSGTQEVIRMQSPVVVYTSDDRKTVYRSPEDADFSLLVNENFRSKFLAAYQTVPSGSISLCPYETKKIVTSYKGIYITGWLGSFSLSGAAENLDFLYHTGLGSKNAQGFGMFTYVR